MTNGGYISELKIVDIITIHWETQIFLCFIAIQSDI